MTRPTYDYRHDGASLWVHLTLSSNLHKPASTVLYNVYFRDKFIHEIKQGLLLGPFKELKISVYEYILTLINISNSVG